MKKKVLDNGLTVLVDYQPGLHTAAISVAARYGSNYDEDEKLGAAHLLEHMLNRGTSKRTGDQILDEIYNVGGDIYGSTKPDMTYYMVSVPAKKLDVGLDVVSDIFFNSKLSVSGIKHEKDVVQNEIRDYESQLGEHIDACLRNLLYSKHPIRRPPRGTSNTVGELTRKDILDRYNKYFVPSNMVVGVVSNQEPDKVLAEIEKMFYTSRTGTSPIREPAVERGQKANRTCSSWPGLKQTLLLLGVKTVEARHPDGPALDVLKDILKKRLFKELRDKRGLTYGSKADHKQGIDWGYFSCFSSTAPKNQTKVERLMLEELNKLKKINKVELNMIKSQIRGTYERSLDEAETIIGRAMINEMVYDDLNYADKYIERVQKLTVDDLEDVAKRYLNSKNVSVVAITPPNSSS